MGAVLQHGVTQASDPWLARWSGLLVERAGTTPVLELGCGSGRDTGQLVAMGLNVVGIDLSAGSIERARQCVPSATFYCQDIRSPFPTRRELGGVLASLALHYFAWNETVALSERIRRRLRIGGVLLCRLNSTNDVNHGATGHSRIADNYYLVEGQPKRFFDRQSVEALFASGWHTLSLREYSVLRYERPKVLWEVVVERVA